VSRGTARVADPTRYARPAPRGTPCACRAVLRAAPHALCPGLVHTAPIDAATAKFTSGPGTAVAGASRHSEVRAPCSARYTPHVLRWATRRAARPVPRPRATRHPRPQSWTGNRHLDSPSRPQTARVRAPCSARHALRLPRRAARRSARPAPRPRAAQDHHRTASPSAVGCANDPLFKRHLPALSPSSSPPSVPPTTK
jgi:hypothetical protein